MKTDRRIYVMSYPSVLNGTYKVKLREFNKKGIRYYLYVLIMRIKYDYVDIVEE
jgi:hypothetical protein